MDSNLALLHKKVDIVYIARIFLSYWLLLGISAIIFTAAGLVYAKYVSKTYSVVSRIDINTDRVRGVRGGSGEYINVNEMMNEQKSFSNEVSYLKSTPLIKQVIKDMNLFTSYYIQKDRVPKNMLFSLVNIYKNSPFTVIVDDNSLQPLNTLFYIRFIDEKNFVLSAYEEFAYTYNIKEETSSPDNIYFYLDGTYEFGQKIKNEYCSFKILLNSHYSPEQYLDKDLYFKFNSPQELAYEFQEALSIRSAFYQSSIADLTFTWDNVPLAKEFLTKLVDKYIEKNLEKKNFNANNTIAYIENQLENASGTLDQSESRLQSFRSNRDVMNITEKTSNLHSEIQRLQRERSEFFTTYQNLVDLLKTIEKNRNSTSFIVPSTIGITDGSLNTLIAELSILSREKQDLVTSNQLRNPRIKTLDANIETVQKVIVDNVNFNISTTSKKIKEIDSQLSELNSEYAQLPQTQRQLLELEREFNINDEVYSSLLNQRIQAKIMMASNKSDCEVIEPVKFWGIASPNMNKILIIFLFLGIFIPSVFIIIVNFLSQKIKTKEDLKNYCSLTSIGDIPHNIKGMNNVISNAPQSPISERFHSIRSNISYYLYGEKNKTILITSTLPNEGKSFSTLNLALSFATTNNKTLLINFDLRKRNKTLKELSANSFTGLDQYLINNASIEDIIQETPYENLDFISNGNIPPDPVILISSPRMKDLFEILKSEYDYILIDTPPFGLVTDAFMLMKYADIIMYVSRLGVVTKRALRQCMDEIKQKEISNIHLIINDLSKIDKTYEYRYEYADQNKKKKFRLFKMKK